MKIKVTTDSTADASKEFFDAHDIGVIPQIVNLGEDEFYDMVNISYKEIEEYVAKTKKLSKTASRSVDDFKDFFESYLNEGYDAIIHISISTKLSSIYNNALAGAEQIGGNKVRVIDGRVLSTGSLLLALSAKDLVDQGKGVDEIVDIINTRSLCVQASFVVDTIDYLYKGGRCSMMAAFGANLLKLKPKLQLVDGKIVSTGKFRGKPSVVLKKYIDETLELYNNPDKTRCFVTHADGDPEVVDEIVEYVKSKNIFDEVIVTMANSVVFTHCGKGTLGIIYINDGGKY